MEREYITINAFYRLKAEYIYYYSIYSQTMPKPAENWNLISIIFFFFFSFICCVGCFYSVGEKILLYFVKSFPSQMN